MAWDIVYILWVCDFTNQIIAVNWEWSGEGFPVKGRTQSSDLAG